MAPTHSLCLLQQLSSSYSYRVNGHAYHVEALEGLDGVDKGPVFLVEEEEELLPIVFQEDNAEQGSERVQFMAVNILQLFHDNI